VRVSAVNSLRASGACAVSRPRGRFDTLHPARRPRGGGGGKRHLCRRPLLAYPHRTTSPQSPTFAIPPTERSAQTAREVGSARASLDFSAVPGRRSGVAAGQAVTGDREERLGAQIGRIDQQSPAPRPQSTQRSRVRRVSITATAEEHTLKSSQAQPLTR